MSTIPDVTEAHKTSRLNWHDIEPILKWVGVAYVFGFLIVMFHTYHLGIPTLQLIEPLNVWIGTPLAIVAFFLDKIYLLLDKEIVELRQALRDAALLSLQAQPGQTDLLSLLQQIYDQWTADLSYIAAPFGGALSRRAVKAAFQLYFRIIVRFFGKQLGETQISETARQSILNNVAPVFRWTRKVAAFVQFLTVPYVLLLLVAACVGYVQVFPIIPQTLGGGKPMSVSLLISRDALPDSGELAAWKTETPSTPAAEHKDAVLVPVTLYLRTEHEFLIRKGDGPIISLSDHAVEGILFQR